MSFNSILLALGLAGAATLHAETFPFPSAGAPLLTIDLPAAWSPKMAGDALEAAEPGDAVYVNLWLYDDESPLRDLKRDFAQLLKETVSRAKLTSDPVRKQLGGIEFVTFRGAGEDLEENTPISFEVWIFKLQPGLHAILYFDRDSDAPPEIMKTLEGIVRSIRLRR